MRSGLSNRVITRLKLSCHLIDQTFVLTNQMIEILTRFVEQNAPNVINSKTSTVQYAVRLIMHWYKNSARRLSVKQITYYLDTSESK